MRNQFIAHMLLMTLQIEFIYLFVVVFFSNNNSHRNASSDHLLMSGAICGQIKL